MEIGPHDVDDFPDAVSDQWSRTKWPLLQTLRERLSADVDNFTTGGRSRISGKWGKIKFEIVKNSQIFFPENGCGAFPGFYRAAEIGVSLVHCVYLLLRCRIHCWIWRYPVKSDEIAKLLQMDRENSPHFWGLSCWWLGQFCWLRSLLITEAVAPREELPLGICHLPGIPEKKSSFCQSPFFLNSSLYLSLSLFSRNPKPRPASTNLPSRKVRCLSHCDISSRGKGGKRRERKKDPSQRTKVTLKELQEQWQPVP